MKLAGLDLSRKRRNAVMSRLDLLAAVGLAHTIRRVRANARLRGVVRGRKQRFAEGMWAEAAAEVGAQMREIAPATWEFRRGEAVTWVRGQTTPYVERVSHEIASDKPLAYRLLAEAGLPIPRQEMVDVRAGRKAAGVLDRVGVPSVVKPVGGGGGSGVTGQVRTASQLRQALTFAGRFSSRALIEQQVPGDTYRVLILDGEILDIIRRVKPQLVGDGTATIEELMFAEFDRRLHSEDAAGIKPFAVDLDCLFALQQTPYRLHDVLPAGESVTVKSATNYNDPHQTFTVAPPYPPSLVSAARRATSALGIRLGGVDVVAADVSAPLEETGGVVLEVNPIPGLNHHYNVAEPAHAVRVAVPILNALLESAASRVVAQA